MKVYCSAASLLVAPLLIVGIGLAQPPPNSQIEQFVTGMLSFDKNHDGHLTRDEITDVRLLRLFDRLDGDHNGVVTETELRDLYRAESAAFVSGRGPGGPDRPHVGQVIPERLQQELGLTAEQRAKLLILQHDVDARLKNLLTEKQQSRLRELAQSPPGANGFRGRPGFPGPPPQ